jgi:AAA+ ATPase superfamily predicted ATPase
VASGVAFGVAYNVAFGVAGGVAFGVAFGAAGGVAFGVVFGVAFGVMFGVVFGVAFGVTFGLVDGMAAGGVDGVAHKTFSFSLMFGVAGGAAFGVAGGAAFGVAVTINWWRPVVLYPFLRVWDTLLYQLDQRRRGSQPSLLRWHSAFWDEWQRLPLTGLDKHVVLVMERNPTEGKAALNYLSTSRQRWAAQAAQIELDARDLEGCEDVAAIRNVHKSLGVGDLESPVSVLLHSFSHISENVDAALNQNTTYNQRLALGPVAEQLLGLITELTRSSEKYAARFLPIARGWSEIVSNYVQELAETTELRQEIDNPYIIGVPLNKQQQIFTGRTDTATRIDQLLLDRRRPPLLLYGQRRMGKTSLLNNLGRLLPNTIIPMFVDLQGAPSSANDYAGFLYNIARGMSNSAKRQSNFTLPPLTREALATDPFTCFDEWLDQVEQTLNPNTALLALDEFEKLDNAISKGRFDEEDILGMLRHLIQHRPRFKVLLSGSHTIEEFQRWASYLINVQVVHISYLKEEEARKLIEQPIPDFTLRYESDAVQRVLQLTRCHPNLVQLLCSEIVTLKNEQDPSIRRWATLADVEAAVPEALSSGSFFFADIERNQVNFDGLDILRFLAAQGEGAIVTKKALSRQFPDNLDSTLNLLLCRELIEQVGNAYRFQVELIRRWFAQKR